MRQMMLEAKWGSSIQVINNYNHWGVWVNESSVQQLSDG